MEYQLSSVAERIRMTKLSALGAEESGKGQGKERIKTIGIPYHEMN